MDITATPVEGTRLFLLSRKNLLLMSVMYGGAWLPGEDQQSTCNHVRAHGPMPPAMGCTCGIWSCSSRSGLIRSYPQLVQGLGKKPQAPEAIFTSWFMPVRVEAGVYFSARILQWGQVIEHEWGYRSEFARIIPATIQAYPRIHARVTRKLVQHLREKYAEPRTR